MIILEGPDGGGKTTLLGKLQARFDLPQRPRFADSSGPYPDLYNRIYDDLHEISLPRTKCQVYDRHSLISDYVYGPTLRGTVLPEFTWPSAATMRNALASRSLVVWCMPPRNIAHTNVSHDLATGNHVDVHRKFNELYDGYLMQRVFWSGAAVDYDYTDDRSVTRAINRIEQHVTEWNMNR